MCKRMWRANLIFTFLFLLSFSMTFCIVYYGMYLKTQIMHTGSVAEQMNYAYRGCYSAFWKEEAGVRSRIKLPETEQGILSYRGQVCGEDVIGTRSAYVIMEMHEELLEPLQKGTYFRETESYDMPQCIIGDAWIKESVKDGDTVFVRVNGFECEVSGVLESNTFAGSDERLFLYGPSLQREFLEELICMEQAISVDYRISRHADSGEIKKYEDWLYSGIFEEVEELPDMNRIDGGVDQAFQDVIPMYNAFFKCMLVFCSINCAFLTCVWCSRKVQENMIKRVYGFNTARIWWDGFKEIALYEIISILISSAICMVIEVFKGNALNFFVTWKYGVGIIVTVLMLLTFLLSMINVFYLKRLKPADTLKATE